MWRKKYRNFFLKSLLKEKMKKIKEFRMIEISFQMVYVLSVKIK